MWRPTIETMEFVPLDGGGTRVEHRFRAENRSGISFLLYRATMLGFRAGGRGTVSTLGTILDEDAAPLDATDLPGGDTPSRTPDTPTSTAPATEEGATP